MSPTGGKERFPAIFARQRCEPKEHDRTLNASIVNSSRNTKNALYNANSNPTTATRVTRLSSTGRFAIGKWGERFRGGGTEGNRAETRRQVEQNKEKIERRDGEEQSRNAETDEAGQTEIEGTIENRIDREEQRGTERKCEDR